MIAILTLAFAFAPAQEPAEGTAQEPTLPLAFLEIDPAEGDRWMGQFEEITIRFGIEDELAENRLISVFRRPLDLPVRLDTTAWNEVASMLLMPQRGKQEDGRSFAWDGELAYAQETVEERQGTIYRVYSVRALLEFASAVSAGDRITMLEAEPARLHLSYATAFETNFLGEREPVSEERIVVESAPLVREVKRLPGGSPQAMQSSGVFSAAQLTASLSPKQVEVGEEFQFEVRVEGERLPPSVDLIHPAEQGWKLIGSLQLEEGRSLHRYQFDGRAEQAGEIEFAPFRLVRFDPDAGEYQQDLSERLTLLVRGADPGASVPAEVDAGAQVEAPGSSSSPAQPAPSQPLPIWVHWLLGAGLLALAAWGRQAMRQSAQRREVERAALGGAPSRASGADREPLEAWLAEQLGWKPAQLIDPRLEQRLLTAGVPQELAARTAHFLLAAETVRYGGPAPRDLAETREKLRRSWMDHAKRQAKGSE